MVFSRYKVCVINSQLSECNYLFISKLLSVMRIDLVIGLVGASLLFGLREFWCLVSGCWSAVFKY